MGSSAARKRGSTLVVLGVALMIAGLLIVLTPKLGLNRASLVHYWPVFLILAGLVRIIRFAVARKPRSPFGGMLLIIIGAVLLAATTNSSLNLVEIYGRYWPVLLIIFGGVELLRYYSHSLSDGAPPRLFTPFRLIVILTIVATGVLAGRLARNAPSFLSGQGLSRYVADLQSALSRDSYTFHEPATVASSLPRGCQIFVGNDFGSIRITGTGSALRATLTKTLSASNEDEAREIAAQIELKVERTANGFKLVAASGRIDRDFTAAIHLEVPPEINLTVEGKRGEIEASGIKGPVSVSGKNVKVMLTEIAGDVRVSGDDCRIETSKVQGNVFVENADQIKVWQVSGMAELAASRGSVSVREVVGPVMVSAPFSNIEAENLTAAILVKSERGEIELNRVFQAAIEAPHSSVRATGVQSDLTVIASDADIRVENIGGKLRVAGAKTKVSAEEARGPLEVDTSGGAVVVKNFYDAVRIRTSDREVKLVSEADLMAGIEVENENGEIKLTLPETSLFDLDAATTKQGRVKSIGFDAFPIGSVDHLSLSLGGGGRKVKLRTSNKNITIQSGGAPKARVNALNQ